MLSKTRLTQLNRPSHAAPRVRNLQLLKCKCCEEKCQHSRNAANFTHWLKCIPCQHSFCLTVALWRATRCVCDNNKLTAGTAIVRVTLCYGSSPMTTHHPWLLPGLALHFSTVAPPGENGVWWTKGNFLGLLANVERTIEVATMFSYYTRTTFSGISTISSVCVTK